MTDQITQIGSLTEELWKAEESLEALTEKAGKQKDCLKEVVSALASRSQCNLDGEGLLRFSKDDTHFRPAGLYPDAKEICDTLNGIHEKKKEIVRIKAKLDRLRQQ